MTLILIHMGEVHTWENHYKRILVVLGTTTIGKQLSRKFAKDT